MTKTFWRPREIAISVLVLGLPVLLFIGAVYSLLSPREWAWGLISWVVLVLLFASVRKRTIGSNKEHTSVLDDDARDRVRREIRKWKAWIGILIVLLPVGIANGVVHRAWLGTFTGVGVSLALISAGMREIKQRRKKLGSAQ